MLQNLVRLSVSVQPFGRWDPLPSKVEISAQIPWKKQGPRKFRTYLLTGVKFPRNWSEAEWNGSTPISCEANEFATAEEGFYIYGGAAC